MIAKRNAIVQDKEVGRRIRLQRLQLGLSQSFLASGLGLTFQQIQKYENGTNRVSAGRIQQIAKILKVTPSFFFDDDIGGSKNGGNDVFGWLDTADSLRIMKAFVQIRDPRIKRCLVELIETAVELSNSHPKSAADGKRRNS